jgi:hypothetical protein
MTTSGIASNLGIEQRLADRTTFATRTFVIAQRRNQHPSNM